MSSVAVSLNFMPAFYTRHLGIQYGEAYYFDPGHRAQVELAEGRFLYEVFGRHGVGSPDPEPSPSFFMQPVDLVMRTQGAQWRFPADAVVECLSTPWANLTPEEICAIDPRDAAHHAVMDEVVEQFHALERLYGASADILSSRTGYMCTHTPYTTAHQLCGEGLFMLMVDDPSSARRIFAKVWEIYEALFARIASVTGARYTHALLGDCSASLLSPGTYREAVLPVNREVASHFARVTYHSCGASDHLLPEFSKIPGISHIQLGAGTDLAAACQLFPQAVLQPLVDPVMMRQFEADAVGETISVMLQDSAEATSVDLCAWAFDRDTPLQNVDALYEAVGRHNAG